ncbi:hypothetical protein FVE85_3934 [Porphyridium purpureum]|uniref:Uncharacterized protein n=1 Tax=Porphyridium purpureum TaxID=35688 RepID=A0A5J4YR52_PORPP|nr:hypothetical protein FVE85_3934 [Porphyridium purpureum]|eukprot:POR5313..scf229_5
MATAIQTLAAQDVTARQSASSKKAAQATVWSRTREGLRYLLAAMFFVLSSPVLLVLWLRLPDCLLVRKVNELALGCMRIVCGLAGVSVRLRSAANEQAFNDRLQKWIRTPMVLQWSSPFYSKGHASIMCHTYDQPGRWMDDGELQKLAAALLTVAKASMDQVPAHRLFNGDPRAVFANRIVSVAYDGDKPVGFTCMVYLPHRGDIILHLGLTMIALSHRGRRIQSPIFTKCLVLPMVNLWRMQYWVTNIAASPAGIGSVCDYFCDVYPDYLNRNTCSWVHRDIACSVLRHFRYEFGCSSKAVFDTRKFVVYRSNMPEGGGSPQFIKEDGKPVSKYRNEAVNTFVKQMLDLTAGDELFQVGRVDLIQTTMKFLLSDRSVKLLQCILVHARDYHISTSIIQTTQYQVPHQQRDLTRQPVRGRR